MRRNRRVRRILAGGFMLLFVWPAVGPLPTTDASFQCSTCAKEEQGGCVCSAECNTVGGCQGCCVGQLGNTVDSTSWWVMIFARSWIRAAYDNCLESCEY